jgi:hypothetical protein
VMPFWMEFGGVLQAGESAKGSGSSFARDAASKQRQSLH